MKFGWITALSGAILLAAALAGPAAAVEIDSRKNIGVAALGASAGQPIGDLGKLRARGAGEQEARSARTREAIGPMLLIILLQQNRFSGGIDILQPVTAR